MNAFAELALRLVRGGYSVLPIEKGSKAVLIPGWRDIHADEAMVMRWIDSKRYDNIGINTRHTPAVDIDVYDDDMAEQMEQFILDKIADAPVRVGQAPKRLLLFRTNKPFRKMSSTWSDKNGRVHKIEILGDGQQFVAFGIHPDTKRPYQWTSLDDPSNVGADDLPLLTVELVKKILDHFDKICESEGWKRVSRADHVSGSATEGDDDALLTYKRVLSISEETITEALDLIENDDCDYDQWLEMGMALHHQFQGDARGLQLWHEWGEKSSKYSAETTDYKWESFGHGPATVTFATILYKAEREKERLSDLEFDKVINEIERCNNARELTGKYLKQLATMSLTEVQQEEGLRKVQFRLKEVKNIPIRLEAVRKMYTALRPREDRGPRVLPKWCENWVFVQRNNTFHNLRTGITLTKNSFDGAFGKHLLTDKQRAQGEYSNGKASDAALNLFEIQQVYDVMYMPGMGECFTMGGLSYGNLFSEYHVPKERPPSTTSERRDIQTIKKHFEMLFPIAEERRVVLDYLAYCVQYPGQKITWALVIQGVSGAGKTWLHGLMAEALGVRNVRSVRNKELRENFTAWGEGKQMVFIEELRMNENDKFQVLENMLTYVGNKTVSIRTMNRTSYEIPNVTNYVMFTMYVDAIPLEDTDRRYYVIRTSLQTKFDISKFRAAHTGYFEKIYSALELNGDIIRHWLLNHEISDDFNPHDHAPETEAKDLMRSEANGESKELAELESIIQSGEFPLISSNLLSSVEVKEKLMLGHMSSRLFGRLLSDAGFTPIGRYRLTGDASDPLVTYYTRDFTQFAHLSATDRLARIRSLAEPDGLD